MGSPRSEAAVSGRAWRLLGQIDDSERKLGIKYSERLFTRLLIESELEILSMESPKWTRDRVAKMARSARQLGKGLTAARPVLVE